MVQVAEGGDPAADRKAERSSGTFGELATHYRGHAMKKNKSWKQADALVTRHLLPRWSKLQPSNITRSDVKSMMARIEAPIVANQTLAGASAIFSWGIHALGVPSPTSEQWRVNGGICLRTMLQTLPPLWARDFEFQMLAPNQKRNFKPLVDGWAAMIERDISARLGEKKERAA
jgi:hypothetical protein